MMTCLGQEIQMKAHRLNGEKVESVYFGGGTPSILPSPVLADLLDQVISQFQMGDNTEITLEANPEDLRTEKLRDLHQIGFNRLSIGIQTFHDGILKTLNRNHSGLQAMQGLEHAREQGFDNISADLMFGLPDSQIRDLDEDLDKLTRFQPEHISLYGLTIEPDTAFGRWSAKGRLVVPGEEMQSDQYMHIDEILTEKGYDHYEVSNFAIPGLESRHNSSYWRGVPYLGVGPGAHSYDGDRRYHMIRHNPKYIKSIQNGILPEEQEELTGIQKVNEYIMVRSRTTFGIDPGYLKRIFQVELEVEKMRELDQLTELRLLEKRNNSYFTTSKGFAVADEIALKLFFQEN